MRISLWFRSLSFYIVLMLAFPLPIISQERRENGTQQQEEQKILAQEELAQLLAPVALYPDELLSQVLMASTYPLEVVAADRWLQKNKDLKGDDLADALESQEWDPSVKSLVNFPSVLSMMSQKLEITAKLGDAFLSQESEVMDTVQMLRKKAMDAGNLKTSPEQKVVVAEGAVIIEPVEPEVVYVPTYDPLAVYGPWFYPEYPPYSYYLYPPPPLGFFAFGPAVSVGFAWGYAWGGFNWHNRHTHIDIHRHRHVNNRHINHSRYIRHYERRGISVPEGRGRWSHDPSHRRGVSYRDRRTAERFGQEPGRISRDRDVRGGVRKGPGTVERFDRKSPARSTPHIRGGARPSTGVGGKAPVPARRSERPAGVVAPRRDSGVSGHRDGAVVRPQGEPVRSGRDGSAGGAVRGDGGGRRLEDSGGDRGRGSHR